MEDNQFQESPVSNTEEFFKSNTQIHLLNGFMDKVKDEVQKIIVGQDKLIELMLVALLADGHVLLEGVPGIAKTLTARLLAKTLDVDFNRIQFTPDLMPSDVTGTNVFDVKESNFRFVKGPIFTNIVLIDEINRSPAKTQSALFEVMEERQATIDGTRYPMKYPFFVLATQNPIEQEGTYRLPEAQLDRFMFKLIVEYPSLSEEKLILYKFKNDFSQKQVADIKSVFSADDLLQCRSIVESITIQDNILDYIAEIVHQTRNHEDLFLGASPRASLSILKSAKALAALRARDFVIPEDVQYVAYPVLNHRIALTPEREMEGYTTQEVVKSIIEKIDVPR